MAGPDEQATEDRMLEQSAKQWVLGSAIGRLLMSGRDALDLVRAALRTPESVGTIANDQLATLLVTRLPQSGKVFIDVGAHIGSIITAVTQCDASIRVVAVEAIPDKAERLRRKFPNVPVHACAVGDQEGEVSFFIHTRQSGYSSLGRPAADARHGDGRDEGIQEVRVPIRRLDDLVAPEGIDVIKIDVEGAELGVLRGSRRLIGASRPVIMFESGPGDAEGLGFTKPGMWQFFADEGYTLHVPNRVPHNDEGLSLEGFVESHTYPRRTTNYFAIPAERRLEIRDRARALLGIVA
ncbi:FkbM family methyltransferase [Ideonella sp. YS5]|uniref:FkbM family methyltransferase n=1 Tax=Ideonella sp. YS5 TaxID=3453714 RepID=UPI003EEA4D98